ncbi:MAG: sigma-70 family RNA polymerase sigma factor [Acidimicrobiia bacterium]|nr:sigma-70 family RNA polymerase sigma factor [Acidimicrobiia bacterium]
MVDPLVDVEGVFRAESGRALATIARLVGDLDLAEDAVQEAFATALSHWPTSGVPDNPGAWITTTARNKALDVIRRESTRPKRELRSVRESLDDTPPILHPVADDQLRVMFTCCHPALTEESRVALTLRLVCGLQVHEIARLLLHGEEAVAKRIGRAKAKIRQAHIPLRVPPPELLAERTPGVLECIYLTFTEGYAATAGEQLIRHQLCDDAVRLARLVAALEPVDPAAEALLALLLLQDSRRVTRLDDHGEVVLLADQDRSRWDHDLIAEGMTWLDRAGRHPTINAGAAAYLLQAAIAAAHARAASWEATDWPTIVANYDQLAELTASPVVQVNRAVAVSFADGPGAALPLLDALVADDRVADSHTLHAVRADVLHRLGRIDDARHAYLAALATATNEPTRQVFRRKLARLGGTVRPT